ncbi:glyoxalase/bleomycin resistance protein/dioxygenase [Deinococcus phoenicis]|uniref:Glyoxalase/bleomycin resistance protein/dioxygenase n=1 Tax=Deinococcus phoenicis TaxID=1476583 RepID=A0A016QQB8_9DEIO|nr:VOC family protein [Deinococcus phoenicis]EYB68037.1 glyoxalase/bleomycin resistance protein/dioxygenase [Deinococcus phoenicis]
MLPAAAVLPPSTHVASVTLLARDLPRLAAFYATLLGLTPMTSSADAVTLGAHGTPLLHLLARPDLPAPAGSRPGLYHTAFLLPGRADLGRWLAHAATLGLRLGTGDHLVSEAIYLQDPEGNGIEVYRDRPRSEWTWQDGQVRMDTLSVDVPGVLAAAEGTTFEGAPAGTSVGHVHLKVGSAAEAARFYADALGLDVVSHFPGAAFLSWGGYHHHLGLNEWHSCGQGRPAAPAAGLGGLAFVTPDLAPLRAHLAARPLAVQDDGDALSFDDPWGNRVTVQAQA